MINQWKARIIDNINELEKEDNNLESIRYALKMLVEVYMLEMRV